MTTLGTKLFTHFKGEFVGEDRYGNKYYTEKKPRKGRRQKRGSSIKGLMTALKFRRNGMPGCITRWISPYLKNRKIAMTGRKIICRI